MTNITTQNQAFFHNENSSDNSHRDSIFDQIESDNPAAVEDSSIIYH